MELVRVMVIANTKKLEVKHNVFECEEKPKTFRVVMDRDFSDYKVVNKEDLGHIRSSSSGGHPNLFIFSCWCINDPKEILKHKDRLLEKAEIAVIEKYNSIKKVYGHFNPPKEQ